MRDSELKGGVMRLWTVSSLFCLLCTWAHLGHGQVIELATAAANVGSSALLGKSVKEIIDAARLAASTALADGRNAANGLMTRGADELNVSIDNAARVFANELEKKFEDLKEEKRTILLNIATATLAIDNLGKKAYTLKDTTALDIRSILGDFPLASETLVLQRVGGLTQLAKSGDYNIKVIGSYLGLPAEGRRSQVSLDVEGSTIKDLRVNPSELHVATLTIPNSQLAPYFSKTAVSIAKAQLNVKHTASKRFLGLFPYEEETEFSSVLHLVLYPTYAGSVSVHVREIKYGWRDIADDSREETGPNAHCSKKCKDHHGIEHEFFMNVAGGDRVPPIDGDIRIVGGKCEPVPGHNGFDVVHGFSIESNLTRAKCAFRARSHPSKYRLTVRRQQWSKLQDSETVQDMQLHYDVLKEIRVPKSTTSVRITGKTLAGEAFDYLVQEPNPSNPVQLIARTENAGDVSLFFRAQRPRDIE